jgi:PmbA protein
MQADLQSLSHRLLDAARKAGAEAADALAVAGRSQSIGIRAGALEQAERAEAVDIGLRVMMGRRQACVSASDTSDATIAALAERAVAMAREAPEDEAVGQADPGQLARGWDLTGLDLLDATEEPAAAALEAMARQAESGALSVSGITQAEADASWSARQMHLALSNGFSGGYARTSLSVSAVAFTESAAGMERDWSGESRTYQADLPEPGGIGRLAAERARQRLDAVKPPTGAYPVLFDERVASSLIGHLLGAINGQSIARGASWLRDAMGQDVLPKGLSVIEDPHRARISGSRPFDGEGLPTARRFLVENGVLKSWTLDLGTGRKLGMASTGNASRSTSAPPSPAASNIALTQGTVSRDDLVRQMGTGLLITSMIGATINPTTGDYSRGAAGFWVEGGEIRHPVHECTVAGNLRDMLRRIAPANDARPHLSMQVPSLLVEGLTLAGK